MDEPMKKKVEYLDWYFTCDDGTADKDAQRAWFELRSQIMNEKRSIQMSSLYAESELERVAQSIASCMECKLCPNPCRSRESSSMYNCASHWMMIITNLAKYINQNEANYKQAERKEK